MSDTYILNEDGEAVHEPDLHKWFEWYGEHNESRRVALWEHDGVRVSTVFLALDHSWGHGLPVLWETMVFGGEYDQDGERYTSREEAEAGHQRWVMRAQRSLGGDA